MEILAIIPARGGSKGLPRKNIRLLDGKPLIYYTINEAKKSKHITHLVVSTDDEEIAKKLQDYEIDVIKRPSKLAQDDTPTSHVVRHVIKFLEESTKNNFEIIIVLQPTSPLRNSRDIDLAIEKFLKTNCETIVAVTEIQHPPYWMYTIQNDRLIPIMERGEEVYRRQDSQKFYQINGAIYIISKEKILKQNTLLSDSIRPFVMPPERSLDIDNELDFKLAELLIKEKVDN